VVKVIPHKAASPPHTVQSSLPGGANVHPIPIYRKTKMVAMATSLNIISPISAFCWPTTQTPLHNQLPGRYCSYKASYSNFSPKIGCHANDAYTLDFGYVFIG